MTDLSADEWDSLSRYLDQALELEPWERDAWLSQLTRVDPLAAAKIAEVFALRGEGDFASFLAAPPRMLQPALRDVLTGRQVGPYVIEAQIGRGGMGSVWRARRADDRYQGIVAVKFIHPVWVGRQAEDRFRIEGNLLGRLSHPHIARLLDAGVLDGTQPYLIIEHVEGESIDDYCARRQLDLESRVRLFLDVLAAVTHAHGQLVVHRDIKPANIFVTREGMVKLLDFGIGKLLEGGSESASVTLAGDAALTPQYAAPEQLLGHPVSAATDVYALGAVLFLLLTGEHPVAARNQQSNADWIQAIVVDVPPLASTRAGIPGISSKSLEGDLDNILHQSLKKDPLERYGSSAAFAEDLQRFLKHEPVYARADTLRYRTQKFVRRHRSGVIAAALIASAVLVGFIGTAWEARRASINARQAEQSRLRALEQLDYADATNEFLSNLLEQSSDQPFTTPDLLERGEEMVNRQFKDDPQQRARLQLTLGELYGTVQKEGKAESLLLAAQQTARSIQDDSLHIRIDCALGVQLANRADFDRALPLLNAGVEQARARPDLAPTILADCLDKRSQVERVNADPQAAVKDARESLLVLGTPRAGQATLALSARTTLASAEANVGNRAVAVREYEFAIRELAKNGREHTGFAVTLMNDMGIVMSRAGQWIAAAQVYEEALAIARSLSNGGPMYAVTQVNYAKLLVDLGREREALSIFDEALGTARRGDNAYQVEMVELLSAPALCALGQLDECAARLEHSGSGLHKQLKPTNSVLGTHEIELAQLAYLRGELVESQSHLSRALAIFKSGSERAPNEMRALGMRAELRLQNGDAASAAHDAAIPVDQAQTALSGFSTSAWLGRAFLVQGEVQRAQKNTISARESFVRAAQVLRSSAGEAAPWTRQAKAELGTL